MPIAISTGNLSPKSRKSSPKVTMYFDLLLLIIEESIAPTGPQFPHDRFIRDLNEGLWDPPDMHNNAVADLLSFCQVSRVWAAAAQIFLFRNVTVTSKTQFHLLMKSISSNQRLALYVRTVKCQSFDVGLFYEFDALPLLMHCPNIYRAMVSPDKLSLGLATIQDAQQPHLPHSISHSGITTFRADLSHFHDLYRVLRYLPSLRILSLASVAVGTGAVAGLSSPTFQLEQLAVSNNGIKVQGFNWLLQSSTQSLKSFSLHGSLGGIDGERDLWQALERCGPSLRHIYLNRNKFKSYSSTDLLSLCPNLTSLKISLSSYLETTHIDHNIGHYLSSIHQPLEHLHFTYRPWSHFIHLSGIECLINTIPSSNVIRTLKQLSIGGYGPKEGAPISALDQLRKLCKDRNIILDTLSNEELLIHSQYSR